ncbi:hypothetical protein ACWA1F_14600 [Flavobacterium sp. 3-218]
MKKTALTFGLFSLVAVATSFANPAISNSSSEKLSIDPPIASRGGQGTSQDGRKLDIYKTSNSANLNETKTFNSDRQSFAKNIKLD